MGRDIPYDPGRERQARELFDLTVRIQFAELLRREPGRFAGMDAERARGWHAGQMEAAWPDFAMQAALHDPTFLDAELSEARERAAHLGPPRAPNVVERALRIAAAMDDPGGKGHDLRAQLTPDLDRFEKALLEMKRSPEIYLEFTRHYVIADLEDMESVSDTCDVLGPWDTLNDAEKLAALRDLADDSSWSKLAEGDRRRIIEREVDLTRVSESDRRQLFGELLVGTPGPVVPPSDWRAIEESEDPLARVSDPPRDRMIRELFDATVRTAFAEAILRDPSGLVALPLEEARERSIEQAEAGWDAFREHVSSFPRGRVEQLAERFARYEASFNPHLVGKEAPLRELTGELIAHCRLDHWPGRATVVDFGLDSSSHLGALQHALRDEAVTPQELDAAMGSGRWLTAIAQRGGENPYRNVTFHTAWDEIGPMPMPRRPEVVAADPQKITKPLTM